MGPVKMKDDFCFAILCWSMVLVPPITAFVKGDMWWLLLWLVPAAIFGMA
jgi:hypothetical protein